MLIPVILFCDLGNVYIQLMIVSSVWLGLLGFADDYIKVFRKHKEGLKGRFKIIGQVGLGIIVGTVMCFSRDIVIIEKSQPKAAVVNVRADNTDTATEEGYTVTAYPGNEPQKTTKTTTPLREEQRVRLPLARSDRQAVGRCTDMAHLHSDSHLHHHGGLQRRQSDRRARRARNGGIGRHHRHHGCLRLPLGQYHLLRLLEHHVHTRSGRTDGLRRRTRGSTHRIPVVQLLSGTGVHGRYRQPGTRRHHRRLRAARPQGTPAAAAVRHLPRGGGLDHGAGLLLPVHQTPLRRRQALLPDGAAAPPLPEKRDSRKQNRRAFLDSPDTARSHDAGNP